MFSAARPAKSDGHSDDDKTGSKWIQQALFIVCVKVAGQGVRWSSSVMGQGNRQPFQVAENKLGRAWRFWIGIFPKCLFNKIGGHRQNRNTTFRSGPSGHRGLWLYQRTQQ